jgi:hypothetical protein
MDQRQTAITAAFVMQGLYRADLDKVYKAYDQGMIELVDAAMEWVPRIDALREAAEAVQEDYPGVFEYEVSLEFGDWLGDSIIEYNGLPNDAHAMEILIDLVESFFRVRDDKDLARRMRAALDKTADAIMAPQAANDGA